MNGELYTRPVLAIWKLASSNKFHSEQPVFHRLRKVVEEGLREGETTYEHCHWAPFETMTIIIEPLLKLWTLLVNVIGLPLKLWPLLLLSHHHFKWSRFLKWIAVLWCSYCIIPQSFGYEKYTKWMSYWMKFLLNTHIGKITKNITDVQP